MMETWKDIEGYEGLYKISNYGNVISVKNGRERPVKLDKSRTTGVKKKTPYCRVMLYKNGKSKRFPVAKLVGKHFLGVDEKYCITYKDGDSTNLRYDNLIPMKQYSIKDIIDTAKIEYNGKTFKGLKELTDYFNIPLTGFYSRIRRGWTLERAVKTPFSTALNNSAWFRYNDNFYTLKELSEMSGIRKGTLKNRIRVRKWSVEQAVDTPKLQH